MVSHEKLPATWWEGVDGRRLLATSRNDLNLHQWPGHFAGLLESPLRREMPMPGIVQWPVNISRAVTPLAGVEPWSQMPIALRPYEIATLHMHIEMGHKLPRHLDSYRHVRATVHRVEEPPA